MQTHTREPERVAGEGSCSNRRKVCPLIPGGAYDLIKKILWVGREVKLISWEPSGRKLVWLIGD